MLLYHYKENFGDNLAPYIVSKILPSEYLYWAKPFGLKRFLGDALRFVAYAVVGSRKTSDLLSYELNKKILISVGSIIEEATENTVVWGAGVSARNSFISRKADIRAVRGYRTIERMRNLGINADNASIGDPAILLPDLYNPAVGEKKKLGIIPHNCDFEEINTRLSDLTASGDVVVISLRNNDVESVIRQIVSCDTIVSTSLHGIIVAHAYSIPALWIENCPLIGDGSKFFDYFSSLDLKEYLPQKFERIETLIRNDMDALRGMVEEKGNFPLREKSKNARKLLMGSFPFDIV